MVFLSFSSPDASGASPESGLIEKPPPLLSATVLLTSSIMLARKPPPDCAALRTISAFPSLTLSSGMGPLNIAPPSSLAVRDKKRARKFDTAVGSINGTARLICPVTAERHCVTHQMGGRVGMATQVDRAAVTRGVLPERRIGEPYARVSAPRGCRRNRDRPAILTRSVAPKCAASNVQRTDLEPDCPSAHSGVVDEFGLFDRSIARNPKGSALGRTAPIVHEGCTSRYFAGPVPIYRAVAVEVGSFDCCPAPRSGT